MIRNFEASCMDLSRSLHIPGATVNFVKYIPQATNISFPDADPTCSRPFQVVDTDICRVALYVTTSVSSGINMEAWLPKDWTGRFLSTGNGGLSGCIQYEDINYGSSLGFATVGTNNGHNGTSGLAFLNNPETVADYAYRSVHTGALVGKAVTRQFYGRDCSKSYYIGCSTGGRQGFQSAQKFPHDFDGIVAGSPTLAFTELTGWAGWLGLLTGYNKTDPGFVSPALWTLIHQEILNQCDGLDGAMDGIIEDPDVCHPDLNVLQCGIKKAPNCLNKEQLRRARGVFEPFRHTNGSIIFPRMQPGSELLSASTFYSGEPSPYVYDWFRYAVYSNPLWEAASLTLRDITYAQELNPSFVNTWNPDLSAFRAAGGRILHYHGLQDHLISSENSARYYNLVKKSMSLAPTELDKFYRFFRIAGMGHCRAGPGAWMIGQSSIGATSMDPESNVLMRMVAWVEKNSAPDTVRGVKYTNDSRNLGVAFARKHCKYPARNVYHGPKTSSDEERWSCVL